MFNKILSFIKKSKKQKYYSSKVAVDVSRRQSIDEITFNNYTYEYVKNDDKIIYMHGITYPQNKSTTSEASHITSIYRNYKKPKIQKYCKTT